MDQLVLNTSLVLRVDTQGVNSEYWKGSSKLISIGPRVKGKSLYTYMCL